MTAIKIKGVVIKGKAKGRKLGFPTANILPAESEIKIESGVYYGLVWLDGKKYPAALFAPESRDILEAHILNFNALLYGREIEAEIGGKLRETIKFKNEKELIARIGKDVEKIKKILERENP
jgi:riboflavin kinase/FMN adenylyltransferase